MSLGGFPIFCTTPPENQDIAAKMSDLGVKCTAPDPLFRTKRARKIFSETPPVKYLDCGVGRIIEGRELI